MQMTLCHVLWLLHIIVPNNILLRIVYNPLEMFTGIYFVFVVVERCITGI